MKTVNLLPDWYLQQTRQNGYLRLHMIIMIVVGVGIVAFTGVARARLATVNHQREAVARQAREVGNPDEQLQKQLAERNRLENLQLAVHELGNTVPMSAVMQQIQNDLTEGMALSRVSIDVRPEPLKGSSFVGAKTPPKQHDVAHLTVVGISPNDVQIAQLIGKISTNSLFSDVSLNYTRTEILRDYMVRRFEIQMQMDLDVLSTEDPETTPKSLAEGVPVNAR